MNQDLSDRDLDDQDLADKDLLDRDLAEAPLQQDGPSPAKKSPNTVLAPNELARRLDECAILLDIDGTLLDLAPTPREVWVPPGLASTLNSLLIRTSGALALVSGRSLNDIDLIFAPEQFPAVGGHGAEMRISTDSEAVATHAPPMDKELKRRLAAIARLSPGILLEDKGYSLALHYRLAPHAEKAIYAAVSLIRADLPNAPIEVLPGKCVCEIKHSGFNKATGVLELMTHEPFRGRRPIFIGDDVTDETVFAIMPDLDGVAFSVGRRAQGVADHFDEPRDVREWLARLLDTEKAAVRP
jgi:trehalose 6-phosphate phosphatase